MTCELHAISTGKQSLGQFVSIASEIAPFVDYIHIRERSWTARKHVQAIDKLVKHHVPLEKIIVNDRLDVALVAEAAGVQLAGHSVDVARVKEKFPTMRIGSSVHSVQEAKESAQAGANYVVYGHIYETNSKKGLQPRGVQQLRQVVESVTVPVIAIGGITPQRVNEVLQSGAKGIAVLSAIFFAEKPEEAAKHLYDSLKGGVT
ncbi:MAG TPA: thiazole tautomerase TenI [Pseudogracilibacillus sp.]|nr:thiazole tautomerase TenI [Pseudogracilibacillus sp.]